MGVVFFKSFAFGKRQDVGVCSKLAKKRIMGTDFLDFSLLAKKAANMFDQQETVRSKRKILLGPCHDLHVLICFVGESFILCYGLEKGANIKKKGADGSVLMTLQTSILTGASQK